MMSIIGCFYEHKHTHNKGLGREYMGHVKFGACVACGAFDHFL